jgi:hypothetical protein
MINGLRSVLRQFPKVFTSPEADTFTFQTRPSWSYQEEIANHYAPPCSQSKVGCGCGLGCGYGYGLGVRWKGATSFSPRTLFFSA